ncbi:odorant receptor 35a [Scaptodrosophila lebanonensis]|uniref:Odorant receptor n=1 Tax=Drosophila lebanonensis TaxID=7225 RepID=A0A6J2U7Y7_DROLE|nr:odorant receptor 35a [Scaptodrosophila lebanonensis]
MQRYVPRLANGQLVPLSWPLALYRRLNHITWPLEPSASRWAHGLDYLLAICGCLIFVLTNDAELRYLRQKQNNVDQLLTGMPTYLVLVESHLRGLYTVLHWAEQHWLMHQFYADIYIERDREPQIFKEIERQMLPSRLVAIMYLVALSGFLLVPIMCLVYRRQDFLYAMVFPFDTTPLWLFVPLLISNIWVGVIIDSMIFGETNLLGEMMMHLNARYLLLQRDLQLSVDRILAMRQRPHMAHQLRQALTELLRRNVALNHFAERLEKVYNIRVFIIFSFSSGLLCALSFKTYTNPAANYTYGMWFVSKTLELLAFGQLGSNLAHTTDLLSSMYYESKWEQVMYLSTNTCENVRLLKLVVVAIEVNAKPFYVTGLKYFRVSLIAVLKILQAAFSYFTFLTSIR